MWKFVQSVLQAYRAPRVTETWVGKPQRVGRSETILFKLSNLWVRKWNYKCGGLLRTTAPGFQFVPGPSTKRIHCDCGKASPLPTPTPPAMHKHCCFFSGLCMMMAKLEIVPDGIKSPRPHLETKVAGNERRNGRVTQLPMSVRVGTETLPSELNLFQSTKGVR